MHSRYSCCSGMFLGTALNGEMCTFDASAATLARGTYLAITQKGEAYIVITPGAVVRLCVLR